MIRPVVTSTQNTLDKSFIAVPHSISPVGRLRRSSGSMPLRQPPAGGGCRGRELHWQGGAARCVRSTFPRGLTISKGAVPGRTPGLGHVAPTYLCRFPGSQLRRPARLRTHVSLIVAVLIIHGDCRVDRRW